MSATLSETAMRSAFQRAGVLTPSQKLDQLAREAWERHPAAQGAGARRKVVREALMGDLTWALIEQWKPSALAIAVGWLLEQAEEQIRQDAEAKASKATRKNRARLQLVETAQPESPKAARLAREEKRAAVLTRASVKLSMLDKVLVNGQPIGDLTPEEALSWASSRERDIRFVMMLTGGLPPGRPIRESWHGDEADKLYEMAEQAVEDRAPAHRGTTH